MQARRVAAIAPKSIRAPSIAGLPKMTLQPTVELIRPSAATSNRVFEESNAAAVAIDCTRHEPARLSAAAAKSIQPGASETITAIRNLRIASSVRANRL